MTMMTEAELNELNQRITQSLERYQLSGEIEEKRLTSEEAKKIFCEYWGTTKTILNFLKNVIPPPAGAIVGVVIGIIITAGDAVHSTLCK